MRAIFRPWAEWSKLDRVIFWIALGAVAVIAGTVGQHITWDWVSYH